MVQPLSYRDVPSDLLEISLIQQVCFHSLILAPSPPPSSSPHPYQAVPPFIPSFNYASTYLRIFSLYQWYYRASTVGGSSLLYLGQPPYLKVFPSMQEWHLCQRYRTVYGAGNDFQHHQEILSFKSCPSHIRKPSSDITDSPF